mmetsp:Transcript_22849/g.20752  ORF Transcript_22849/g.20752 Transcript_22849/m.20752 type:complete len:232 (-) Transcript_22849:1-696(-)
MSSELKPIIIYGLLLSGNVQKVLIALNIFQLKYEFREVPRQLIGPQSYESGHIKSKEFLQLNPRGFIPIIIDPNNLTDESPSSEGLVLWDTATILTYLAYNYKKEYYPVDKVLIISKINYWLAFTANEIQNSVTKLRQSKLFQWDISPLTQPIVIELSLKTLSILNSQLSDIHSKGNRWLVGDNPTIADIVVFPYIAWIEQSELSLNDYPDMKQWINDFSSIPNYVTLPGL